MDTSDPYRSTNPWSLMRYLKNNCRYCPACRNACAFDITFDRDEEIIHVFSDCQKCGRTEIVPFIEEDGDLKMVLGGGDRTYEPDAECFELAAKIGSRSLEGADRETLDSASRMAARYAATRRPSESVEMGRTVAAEYRNNVGKKGWSDAKDLCLAQVMTTAMVMSSADNNKGAIELFDEYLPLTDGCSSGRSFAFLLARSSAMLADGNVKESTASVRDVVSAVDRMKAENGLPSDDPFIRSRAYETLGVLLSAKNDKAGSMKAMKKAFEDSMDVVGSNVSDEGLRWVNRCSREYAFACQRADMKKRSMEALKDSVKLCAANKGSYPYAYAESLLERGMFITDSGMELPPYLRKDMEEAIEILCKPDVNGKYDPLLPIAYFYHSMTGPDKDKLDAEDMGKAYVAIKNGVNSGDVPESVLTSVMDTYATYLDVYDEEKAGIVRKELAEMGIWVHPPLKKKPKTE